MEQALVRLLSRDGKHAVGVGFLVGTRHILTCAHVITSALGLPPTAVKPPPSQAVLLDFPLLDPHQRKARLSGQVVAWRTYQDKPPYGGDIACLELDTLPPSGAQPAQIKIKTSLWKHSFRSFGVPSGYNQGIWAEGEILGRQSNGYFQVERTRTTGYALQPGFSGGPVWSDQMQAVVAMLALAEKAQTVEAAFAIPARILMEVLSEVGPGLQQGAEAITTLSQLFQIDAHKLPQVAQQTYAATQHNQADTEDLLGAALLQVWTGRYDLAKGLLERLLQKDPTQSYGYYALALCHFQGQSPERLQNFSRAREISDILNQATLSEAPAHIHLLFYYLKQAYFQRNGFTAFTGNLQQYAAHIRMAEVNTPELDALARLLPEITNLPLWREIYR